VIPVGMAIALSPLGRSDSVGPLCEGFPDCTLPRTLAASNAPEVGLTAPIPERRQVACSHQQFSAELKLATEERHCNFMKRTPILPSPQFVITRTKLCHLV
jgi:hypothetical protein